MINSKTTIILAVLFFIVGGIAFWDLGKWNEERKDAIENRGKIFDSSNAEIHSIRYADIEFLCERKEGCSTNDDSWKINKPIAVPADKGRVIALVSTIRSLKSLETIPIVDANDEKEKILEFGLSKPQAKISITWANSKEPMEILLGTSTAVGFNQYFYIVGRKEISIISNYLFRLLENDVTYWREKKFFPQLLGKEFRRIDWKHFLQAEPIDVFKNKEDWYFEKPNRAKADTKYIEGLVSTIFYWQATKVLSKAPSSQDLNKKYERALSLNFQVFEPTTKKQSTNSLDIWKNRTNKPGELAYIAHSNQQDWWGEISPAEVNRFAASFAEMTEKKK